MAWALYPDPDEINLLQSQHMTGNYLRTACRNLLRNKSYSLINLFGLTLSIISCLLIFLVTRYQLNYDRFNKKVDRTYRVTMHGLDYNSNVSMALVPALRSYFPELENVSQTWYNEEGLVKVGEQRYKEKSFAFADKELISIFDYTWLAGSAKSALADPNSIVLTESIAQKYFGKQEALGQVINLNNQHNLKVTGVVKDIPGNTHFPFNFLVSFETIRKQKQDQGALANFYWISNGAFSYLVLPPNARLSNIQGRMHAFIESNWGKDLAKDVELILQPVTEIPFDTRYINNLNTATSRDTYYALIAIALLIMIIACVNFLNLTTAQAIKRTKEVGVRKVLGSSRLQLIMHFISETFLLVTAALVLALILTSIALPYLNKSLDFKLEFTELLQPFVLSIVFLSTALIIVLAGLYPAYVLSAYNPIQSIKPGANVSKRITVRKTLVVLQFAISQVMVAGTLIVAFQVDFLKNKDLGFVKEAVISFYVPDSKQADVLNQQLAGIPGVNKVSFSSGAPPYTSNFTNFNSPESGMIKDDVTELKLIDERYTDMFALKMLAGRQVTPVLEADNDSIFNIVVNQTLISKLGITDPQEAIGKQIFFNGNRQGTIMGVAKDFQSGSRHVKITPCILMYRKSGFETVSASINPETFVATIAGIDKTWSSLFPDELFSYEFLDDHIAALYRQEEKVYTVFKLFSGIAILIGCLGLYGLISFSAAQRTREVGIRKVLGASMSGIVLLFSREFVSLIVIAFLIAAPLAYFVMNKWLQEFAYQVNVGPGIFLITIILSFVIASVTIGYRALSAARVNPAKSLRSE